MDGGVPNAGYGPHIETPVPAGSHVFVECVSDRLAPCARADEMRGWLSLLLYHIMSPFPCRQRIGGGREGSTSGNASMTYLGRDDEDGCMTG